MHEYTHIIVSKMTPRPDRADINDSKQQYDCYLRLLSELNLEIIEIDAGSSFPENVILEDIAIVCHGIALLLKPKTGQEQLVSFKFIDLLFPLFILTVLWCISIV